MKRQKAMIIVGLFIKYSIYIALSYGMCVHHKKITMYDDIPTAITAVVTITLRDSASPVRKPRGLPSRSEANV